MTGLEFVDEFDVSHLVNQLYNVKLSFPYFSFAFYVQVQQAITPVLYCDKALMSCAERSRQLMVF
jgi:hypothetical protein